MKTIIEILESAVIRFFINERPVKSMLRCFLIVALSLLSNGNAYAGINYGLKYKLDSEKGIAIVTGLEDTTKTDITIPASIYSGRSYRVNSIASKAFKGCTKLRWVTLSEGLYEIGEYAFSGCTNLQEIDIPYNVCVIGKGAFFNCSSLTYVNIPSTVSTIENSTFSGCKSLTSITIRATKIGTGAFSRCYNLKTILCTTTTAPTISNNRSDDIVFDGTSKTDCILFVPEGSSNSYKNAKTWKEFSQIKENAIPVTMRVEETKQLFSESVVGDNPTWANKVVRTFPLTTVSTDGVITAKAAGTDTITATNRDGYVTYFVVNVQKGKQKISWEQTFDTLHVYDDIPLTATSSSGLDVKYRSEDYYFYSADALVRGSSLHCAIADSFTLEAYQPGNENYEPSDTIRKKIVIVPALQTITWNQTFESFYVGDAIQLEATTTAYEGREKVSFVVTTGQEYVEISKNSSNNYYLKCKAVGNATIEAQSNGDTYHYAPAEPVSKTITIIKRPQTITWNQSFDNICVGDTITLMAQSSGNLNIDYTGSKLVEIKDNKLICKGEGYAWIEARQSGNEEYDAAASVSKTIRIEKNQQSITWEQSFEDVKVGDEITLSATASSGLSVDYIITQGFEYAEIADGKIVCKAVGDVTIKARQSGNDEYDAAESVSKTISIAKKSQTITWEQSFEDIHAGDEINLIATASSGLSVEYVITDGSEYAEIVDGKLICKAGGNLTIEARQSGNEEYGAAESISKAVTIEEPVIVVQSIALDKTNIEICTSRTEKLSVIFTPENTTDKTVEWTSENPSTAKVFSDGTVFGVSVGTTTVTATTTTGLTATCTVVVNPLRIQSISWEQQFANVHVGDEIELTATASSGLDVEYVITQGAECAEIKDGKLICKAAGEVTIEARQEGLDPYDAAKTVSKTITISVVTRTIPITIDGLTYDYCENSTTELQVISNTAEVATILSKVEGLPVTTINRPAFYHDSNVKEVYVPASVTNIKDLSFEQNYNLTKITVDVDNPNYCDVDGVLYSKDKKTLVTFPAGKDTLYVVADGVTAVGDHAFSCNSHLTSVSIPEGVTSIGFDAFYQGYGLKEFTFPSTIESLDYGVLRDCSSLEEIHSRISNPLEVSLGSQVFEYIDKEKCILYVPVGTKSLYEAADQWKDFKNIVEENANGNGTMLVKGISIAVNNRTLIIKNAPANSYIRVYTLAGQLVYAGQEPTIQLPHTGTFIVNVGGVSEKVSIK